MKVNKKRLAEFFNVDPRTIERWQSQGMPLASGGGKGVEAVFDSAAVIEWYAERDASIENEKLRKEVDDLRAAAESDLVPGTIDYERYRLTRAQADAQELKNAERKSEVMDIELFTYILQRIAQEIVGILSRLPLTLQRKYPPSHAGVITVYDDSKPGTLNDFLGAMTEDDVRPEALRRFEAMVEEVARQASEASRNATAAGQASEQAQTSAGQASESATAAVNAAGAAEASATQAASSAASAESSAGTATTKAGEASASAASADTARTAAAASAAAAKTSEANADASRTAAGDSAAAAAASATAAQTSAERAGASETAAKTSETQAASSAGDAGASATAAAASEKAAAASAAAAKTSETNAATSASTAAASATAASSSASEASTHAAASDTSASLAAQSSTAAGAAATRAEDAAKRAEDIADVISLEDASLTKKGIVKLSSATDSDSEALAATPKAVHAVMDEVQTKAPLDSPVFTGTPTTPTPPDDAKGLQTANAEFVRKLIAALVGSVSESLDTLQELADALGNDPNFATTVLNKLAGKQPLDDTLTALSGKSIEGLIEYVGLRETINHAADALQKSQNGADIPDKSLFVR
ncbi:hypothetical protein D5Q25_23915, partial [Salmonella enterica subsp. enterica serovar Chester]|nr:hypothetical protein [Salmonella enterica subsp. enterica serovar Chester]